jgi:hypothetical protein
MPLLRPPLPCLSRPSGREAYGCRVSTFLISLPNIREYQYFGDQHLAAPPKQTEFEADDVLVYLYTYLHLLFPFPQVIVRKPFLAQLRYSYMSSFAKLH